MIAIHIYGIINLLTYLDILTITQGGFEPETLG